MSVFVIFYHSSLQHVVTVIKYLLQHGFRYWGFQILGFQILGVSDIGVYIGGFRYWGFQILGVSDIGGRSVNNSLL